MSIKGTTQLVLEALLYELGPGSSDVIITSESGLKLQGLGSEIVWMHQNNLDFWVIDRGQSLGRGQGQVYGKRLGQAYGKGGF